MEPHVPPTQVPQLSWLELLEAQEREAFASAVLRPPRSAIRLHAGRNIELPMPAENVAWHPLGRLVPANPRPSQYLAYAAGDFFIQDAGSLLALALIDLQPDHVVCDLCAAPGGKASAILERMGSRGWLLANETIHSRLAPLEYNLARTGNDRYLVSQLDPLPLCMLAPGRFDVVLVDAPCSGQTLVGRGKQSSASFTARQVAHSAARQQRILRAASSLVREGGQLIYSTCTFAIEENEAPIEQLCHEDPHWQPDPHDALAAWESPRMRGCYRLWPHRQPTAGAFAARLRRVGPPAPPPPFPTTDQASNNKPSAAKHPPSFRTPRDDRRTSHRHESLDQPWGTLRDVIVDTIGQRSFAWPADVPADLRALARSGPEVSYQTGKTWRPSHSLALRNSNHWQPDHKQTVDDAAAIRFLSGQPIPTDTPDHWTLILWRDRPLGWLKGTRNHLPPHARGSPVA
jgi:16S rRNA C967 or C1407 C5-methylase (RsmB/RsmF family)